MAATSVALGRPCGKVDVDVNGLATYSLKLEAPRGIGYGNDPELSFEYSQGAPNGLLGVGWALGGMSAIRLGPASIAYDGNNDAPAGFDPFVARLNLDGKLLLNVQGDYFASNAIYRTEIDNMEQKVSVSGPGFVLQDSTGHRKEYGTSTDSQTRTADGETIREWRIKKQIDPFGNCITFNYQQSQELYNSELGIFYAPLLSTIAYTSNETAGVAFAAQRLVTFEYSSRSDAVVQCIYGERVAWNSLLTAVHFSLVRNPTASRARSYQIGYVASPTTATSHIATISEIGYSNGQSYRLDPTTFTYEGFDDQPDHFQSPEAGAVTLPANSSGALMVMPLNISGRALADLACFCNNPNTGDFTVRTFLAQQTTEMLGHGPALAWPDNQGNGAEVLLPPIDQQALSKVFAADLSGDGRVDLIVPFAGNDSSVQLCVLQSCGTGFKDPQTLPTTLPWDGDSRFMAMDLTGRGTNEIVQIFRQRGNLALRTYPSISDNAGVPLVAGEILQTDHAFDGTVDWLQVLTQKNGAKCLVRVWLEPVAGGLTQLNATTYTLKNPQAPKDGFREMVTSALGQPTQWNVQGLSVLSCDINADGVQDIVTCLVDMSGGQLVFTFNTYLGDGLGTFSDLGAQVTKSFDFSAPANEGSFYVTNLNGTQLPQLTYIYQEADSRDVVCYTASGTWAGQVGNMTSSKVVQNVTLANMQVSAVDINGTGIHDVFIYTPQDANSGMTAIQAAYNVNRLSNFMSSTTNSLGLKSDITYGPLTDPLIYKSSIKWNDYDIPARDHFPILAAPNLVVSKMAHSNDASVNSIEYDSYFSKLYKDAKSSRLGRGWQGFSAIVTANSWQGATTSTVTETFAQDFPKTGLKIGIDTASPANAIIKSEKLSYSASNTASGPWKIFRTDRSSSRTAMLENGTEARVTGSDFAVDNHGNVTMKHEYESIGGSTVHEVWERYSYTSINGINGLATAKKTSSLQNNTDMTTYQSGDLSLTLYQYDGTRATLDKTLEWCSDLTPPAFATTQTKFDAFGNQVSKAAASGLTTSTIFDAKYNSFPVRIDEQGTGVSHTLLAAYNEVTGLELAHRDASGVLSASAYDAFGRCTTTNVRNVGAPGSGQKALDFLGTTGYVIHDSFAAELASCELSPNKTRQFKKVVTAANSIYLCATTTLQASNNSSSNTEIVEAVSCANLVGRRSCQQGQLLHTWKYWQYNPQGAPILQSYPANVPPGSSLTDALDLVPVANSCLQTTFDALQRPLEITRPGHSGTDHFIVTKYTYTKGGSTVQEQRLNRAPSGVDQVIWNTSKSCITIQGKQYTTQTIDENGLKSTFAFDGTAHLLSCQDAGGQTETRTYNSRGHLLTLNNRYQNMQTNSTASAMTKSYDAGGYLVSESNALGELTKYKNDVKGRPLQKVGHDGRTIVYTYDENSLASLASVTIYPTPSTATFESKVQYEYDGQGRPQTKTLTFGNGSSYSTKISYDWQGKIVQNTLPDGTVIEKQWQGGLLSAIGEQQPSSNTWIARADYLSYSPFEKPTKYQLSGTSFAQDFVHDLGYDNQGFPLSHSLIGAAPLVQNQYTYGDLDMLNQVRELGSGYSADYTYSGRRLATSSLNTGTANSYVYDTSGNMTSRGATTISHDIASITGVQNSTQSFQVSYDGAGRMVQRITPTQHVNFSYDAFGFMQKMTDASNNASLTITADAQGHAIKCVDSDGRQEILVNSNYSVIVDPDGKQYVRHALFNDSHLLASVVIEQPATAPAATMPDAQVAVHFCDTKGNVTHTFKSHDSSLRNKNEYDDYGLAEPDSASDEKAEDDDMNTYEARYLSKKFGLLNFGARWYDPLVGRFATPDDVTDIALLYGVDGMNRHAFENNNPINHIDPTGHWSLSSIFGVIAGVALVVASVALTAATGGAAAPLLAVVVSGALMSGGIAGVSYSIEHRNEQDAGKFWGGWGMSVGINAAVGAVTAGIGAGVTAASKGVGAAARLARFTGWAQDTTKFKVLATGLKMGGEGLLSGTGNVFSSAGARAVNNTFYGGHNDVWGHVLGDFGSGFASGAALSGAKTYWDKVGGGVKQTAGDSYKSFKDPGFSNVHEDPGAWTSMFKQPSQVNNTIVAQAEGAGVQQWTQVLYTNPFGK